MTLSEFIGKWICSDEFCRLDNQGSINFQGLTAVARFPSPTIDPEKELVYAFSIVGIHENGLEAQLQILDKLLTKTYGIDE